MEKFNYVSKIEKVDINLCVCADWNYKEEGTEEDIEKLARSILKDGSPGVLAAREIEKDGKIVFEIVDGNHRLIALRDKLNCEEVIIENFGKVEIDEAIMRARRRNHSWFDDNKLKLAELYNEFVFPKYEMEELVEFMPDSMGDLEGLKNLAEFDWNNPNIDAGGAGGGGPSEPKKEIKLFVNEEVFNLWSKWLTRSKDITGLDNKERAFEFAVIEALNTPEDQLQDRLNQGEEIGKEN